VSRAVRQSAQKRGSRGQVEALATDVLKESDIITGVGMSSEHEARRHGDAEKESDWSNAHESFL